MGKNKNKDKQDAGAADVALPAAAGNVAEADSTEMVETLEAAGTQLLHESGYGDNLKKVNQLLARRGIDVDFKDKYGETPLMNACYWGRMKIVEALVAAGADVHRHGQFGDTPFSKAAGRGYKEIMDFLISKGVVAGGLDEAEALCSAAYGGQVEVVRFLLDSGDEINRPRKWGTTPLIKAAGEGHFDTVKLLIERGAAINAKESSGESALMLAAKKGSTETAKLLIEKGATIVDKGDSGDTVMLYAAKGGKVDMIKLLVSHGASIHDKNDKEETTLMLAENAELIQFLMQQGVDVKAKSTDNTTALHHAALYGGVDIVRQLVESGVDINSGDSFTALYWASLCGKVDVVKYLVEQGADPSFKDYKGETALQVAKDAETRAAFLVSPKPAVGVPSISGAEVVQPVVTNTTADEVKAVPASPSPVPEPVPASEPEPAPTVEAETAVESDQDDDFKSMASHVSDDNAAYESADEGRDKATQDTPTATTTTTTTTAAEDCNAVKSISTATSDTNITTEPVAVAPATKKSGKKGKKGAATVSAQVTKLGQKLYDAVGYSPDLKEVKQLLATPDISVNFQAKYKITPLMQACYYGHTEIVKLLIAAGADISLQDEFGRCALTSAARSGKLALLKYLHQDLGGDLRADILPEVVGSGGVECVTYLLDNGIDVNTLYKYCGYTTLMRAAEEAQVDVMKLLIARGANVVAKGTSGDTAIMCAAKKGSMPAVKLLISHGASIHDKNDSGENVLFRATYGGDFEMVKFLVEQGADVKLKTRDNKTALFEPATYGRMDIVKLLVENGVDINANTGYQTALHWASIISQVATIEYLIANGADWTLKDNSGRTALDVADKDSVRQAFARAIKLKQESNTEPTLPAVRNSGAPPTAAEEAHVTASFVSALQTVAALSLQLGYPTQASLPYSINYAFTTLLATTVALPDYSFPQAVPYKKLLGRVPSTATATAARSVYPTTLYGEMKEEEVWGLWQLFEVLDTESSTAASAASAAPAAALTKQTATPETLATQEDYEDLGLWMFGPAPESSLAPSVHSGPSGASDLVSVVSITAPAPVHTPIASTKSRAELDKLGEQLHKAASSDNKLERVRKLIFEEGAEIEYQNQYGDTALMKACQWSHFRIVKALVEAGANVHWHAKYDDSPFSRAAGEGCRPIMDYLISKGVAVGPSEPEALNSAASGGHTEIVRFLLDSGDDVNRPRRFERTPLQVAASEGREKTVELLVERGAKVDSSDYNGDTPLIEAAKSGKIEIVKLLLSKGANVHEKNNNDETVLMRATGSGDMNLVRLLVEQGADVKAKSKSNETALHEPAIHGSLEIVRFLVERGADINAHSGGSFTALYWASLIGQAAVVKYLVEQGADQTLLDHQGKSALDVAKDEATRKAFSTPVKPRQISSSQPPTVEAVKAIAGADDYTNRVVDPIALLTDKLYEAAGGGDVEQVKQLLSTPGLRIDQRIQNSETALIQACYVGHLEVVRLLVEVGGADLNLQDQDGWTALHWAAYNGHVPVVTFLLAREADTTILSKKGSTAQQSTSNLAVQDAFAAHSKGHSNGSSAANLAVPPVVQPPAPPVDVLLISPFTGLPEAELNDMLVDLSAKGDFDKVKLLLITQGISIDYKNASAETALIQACYEGHLPVAQLLMEKGANLNLRDGDGWTALHWAAYNGNAELVKLLLHHGADTTILSKKGSTALQCTNHQTVKDLFGSCSGK